MQQSDKQCFLTSRSELSVGHERQEGLIAKVSNLEQAQAALQAESAAVTPSFPVDVPLNGQVRSSCSDALAYGRALCLTMANSSNANAFSAVSIVHTLCALALCVLHSLHGHAASIHTAWLHSSSGLIENFPLSLRRCMSDRVC